MMMCKPAIRGAAFSAMGQKKEHVQVEGDSEATGGLSTTRKARARSCVASAE